MHVQGNRAVVDTNVFVGALNGREGSNRKVIRACLARELFPVMGQALFLEYVDVLGRDSLFWKSPLTKLERQDLLDAYLSACEWVQVYYSWRPNLPDEGDNHLMELALAGAVDVLITNNVADFERSDLHFPSIRIRTPAQFLKEKR
jgi:putative PIN family toxin of toxin-antitoxin system